MVDSTKACYLRLMELVSRGYVWDDALLLASAPVEAGRSWQQGSMIDQKTFEGLAMWT